MLDIHSSFAKSLPPKLGLPISGAYCDLHFRKALRVKRACTPFRGTIETVLRLSAFAELPVTGSEHSENLRWHLGPILERRKALLVFTHHVVNVG